MDRIFRPSNLTPLPSLARSFPLVGGGGAGARRSVEDGPTRAGQSRGGHSSTPGARPSSVSCGARLPESVSYLLLHMLDSAWWGRQGRGGALAGGRRKPRVLCRQLKLGEGTTRRPRLGSDTRPSPPGGPPIAPPAWWSTPLGSPAGFFRSAHRPPTPHPAGAGARGGL